jgi:16S rRNA (uracil1498-N3)-methyltransferase
MREIRVHLPGPLAAGPDLPLPAQAAAHVSKVLRLRAGEALTVFDGRGGEWDAVIAQASGKGVTVRLGAHHAIERESPLRVTLLQALARGEKMDWVLQKATELGVTRIVPVATERSVVQLDGERAGRRLEHWQGIVAAACEQCGRNRLPEVLAPQSLAAACALAATSPASVRLVLAPGATASLAATASAAEAGASEVALLIGPEGGLGEAELRIAAQAGFVAVALGPRVLRTETASIAALGVLQLVAGDFGEP